MPILTESVEIKNVRIIGNCYDSKLWCFLAYECNQSYKARTAKGKSLGFLCLIFFGYIAGIISKLVNEAYMASFADKWYVLFFYVLNLIMVGADLILYFRNRKLDKKHDA